VDAANGDAFVPALLAPAMVLGEDLQIDAEVDSTLLRQMDQAQRIMRCWQPKLAGVKIAPRAQVRRSARADGGREGLFFSMGVDSSYSLQKNVEAAAAGGRAIEELIVIEGCDMYLWESARFPALLRRITLVAEALGKEVLHVTTNLRDFSDQIADWVTLYYGGALASTALALGSHFRRVQIAAAQTYRELVPSGGHPLLDPLWSTGSTIFEHDGLEATRLDKIRFIARNPLLIRHLRVCATDHERDIYNCGECEKCLRTMIGLHVAGVLESCETLPHEIDPKKVRRLTVKNRVARGYMQALVEALGATRKDAAIKAALQHSLSQAAQPD
jgi:hypothetical protein